VVGHEGTEIHQVLQDLLLRRVRQGELDDLGDAAAEHYAVEDRQTEPSTIPALLGRVRGTLYGSSLLLGVDRTGPSTALPRDDFRGGPFDISGTVVA
jgi:hypothetical protein